MALLNNGIEQAPKSSVTTRSSTSRATNSGGSQIYTEVIYLGYESTAIPQNIWSTAEYASVSIDPQVKTQTRLSPRAATSTGSHIYQDERYLDLDVITIFGISTSYSIPQTTSTPPPGPDLPSGPDLLQLTPDLGSVDFDSLFEKSRNPLLLEIPISELALVEGAENSPGAKGIGHFTLQIDGQVYSIPLEYRRRLRTKRGGRVWWKTTTGDSGSFRYFPKAPPVFEESGLVRS